MAQKRTPTTFSNLLVSDRRDPVSKTLSPNPDASPAAIAEIQSDKGALLVSRLTTAVLDALAKEDPVTKKTEAVNGMIAYDSDKKKFVFFQDTKWLGLDAKDAVNYVEGPDGAEDGDMVVFGEHRQALKKKALSDDPVPAHLVKGPVSSIPGNVAVFKDATGSEIADSGLNVQKMVTLKGLGKTDLLQLSNLGVLQFIGGLGVILVDDLMPLTYVMRGTGLDAQVCTVFGGDLPKDSSSPSALVEINSETGALLVSRMKTQHREKLVDPQNGMIVYDTDVKSFFFYQNKTWVALPSGGGSGDVMGPSASVPREIPLFEGDKGKKITNSGMVIDDEKRLTGLGSLYLDTPQPGKKYSVWATSGIVALDYYVLSSQKFKTVLARDTEIHEEVESLWNALSFVQYTRSQDTHKHKHMGLIAEEVADIAPHWVTEHDEGIALNKSALLDSACVMIQKLMKENKALHKSLTHQEKKLSFQTRKLDHFIKVFNQRARKQGAPAIEFEEANDE